MEVNRTFQIIFVIILLAAVVTFAVAMLFKKKSFYKYIPAILAAIAGVSCYIKALCFSRSFEDIGYLLLSIGLAIFSVTSLFTALVIRFTTNRIQKM